MTDQGVGGTRTRVGKNVRAAVCASVHRGESNKTQAYMSRHKSLNAHLELLFRTFSSSLPHFERTEGNFRIKLVTQNNEQ